MALGLTLSSFRFVYSVQDLSIESISFMIMEHEIDDWRKRHAEVPRAIFANYNILNVPGEHYN